MHHPLREEFWGAKLSCEPHSYVTKTTRLVNHTGLVAEPHGDIELAQGRGCWATGLRGVHSAPEVCVLGSDSHTDPEIVIEQQNLSLDG